MEVCSTFGMLEDGMAEDFKKAGLDYYNHNLDTDPERYNDIIHTRNTKTAWILWAKSAMPV